jgi:metal-responsive CopG/Arc/MetJ family transcriptional regulator
MSTGREQYEVVSVSLPRNLVRRANALIPKTRRSRIIANMLTAFLDSIARKQLEHEYTAYYYTQRSDHEAKEERDLLAEWELSDEEAWAILEKEELRGRRKAG